MYKSSIRSMKRQNGTAKLAVMANKKAVFVESRLTVGAIVSAEIEEVVNSGVILRIGVWRGFLHQSRICASGYNWTFFYTNRSLQVKILSIIIDSKKRRTFVVTTNATEWCDRCDRAERYEALDRLSA